MNYKLKVNISRHLREGEIHATEIASSLRFSQRQLWKLNFHSFGRKTNCRCNYWNSTFI